jgi:hypothetical protein
MRWRASFRYANGPALRAMKKQISYPDDAVLVFDLLSVVRVDAGLISGERRRIDVRQRGQQRFPKTDGWGSHHSRAPAKSASLRMSLKHATAAM